MGNVQKTEIPTYHKIEGLFKRSMDGDKKLIIGDYRNETVDYLKDMQWVHTIKVDGMNIRVHWDGHNVTFGGRTDAAQLPADLVQRLEGLFKTPEAEEIFEQMFGEKAVTLFGEGYGGKIQGGGNYRKDPDFIMFDVLIDGLYLKREAVCDIAAAFGVDVVPVALTGTIEDGIEYVKATEKCGIGDAVLEGLVSRPACELLDRLGNRVIVKIKKRDY